MCNRALCICSRSGSDRDFGFHRLKPFAAPGCLQHWPGSVSHSSLWSRLACITEFVDGNDLGIECNAMRDFHSNR